MTLYSRTGLKIRGTSCDGGMNLHVKYKHGMSTILVFSISHLFSQRAQQTDLISPSEKNIHFLNVASLSVDKIIKTLTFFTTFTCIFYLEGLLRKWKQISVTTCSFEHSGI